MAEPVLSLCNISKSFGPLRVSDDVSLDLHPGQIHALIGPNGAGKSTLIAQIAGALKPDSGQILLGGVDVSELDVAQRARRGLARSFQVSSVAPEFTVLQNVMLAAQGAMATTYRFFTPVLRDRDLVERASVQIKIVGLLDRSGVPAAILSHGERRRLEIAMALALNPKAFLLDEPMAGIGPDGSGEIMQILQSLPVRAPVLLVEHDMDVVFRLANRISVLVDGRIIASGTAREIQADPSVKKAYLGEEAGL